MKFIHGVLLLELKLTSCNFYLWNEANWGRAWSTSVWELQETWARMLCQYPRSWSNLWSADPKTKLLRKSAQINILQYNLLWRNETAQCLQTNNVIYFWSQLIEYLGLFTPFAVVCVLHCSPFAIKYTAPHFVKDLHIHMLPLYISSCQLQESYINNGFAAVFDNYKKFLIYYISILK